VSRACSRWRVLSGVFKAAETVPTFSGHIRYFDERKRVSNCESSLRIALGITRRGAK